MSSKRMREVYKYDSLEIAELSPIEAIQYCRNIHYMGIKLGESDDYAWDLAWVEAYDKVLEALRKV